MYLRNLYFRTCYLLLMEVVPVFVLEGKAPTLKYQTIADRNAIQFKGAKPKSDKVTTGKDRTRFHFVLKQCEEMLRYMGLACITGMGEAESMCAYLNADGLVSGCISQDSDCFAYGANVVYRNFSISHQGSNAASGGAVDVYDIRKANASLQFGRNKIVALALLCGSDYNEGVHGVGKDSALKFMNNYKDEDILDRMRLWRKKESMFTEMEAKITNKNMCSSCGHFGKVQSHTRNGCMDCRTTKGCDFTKYKEQRLDIKNELQIRTKSLTDPDFPNEDLIKEYLVRKDDVAALDLKWKQPNLIKFVKFTNKFLGWEEIYAFEKLLPILTRWQIMNFEVIANKVKRNSLSEHREILFPSFIKKIRNPKGIQSYEIIWEDRYSYFENLIPDEQLEEYSNNKNNSLESLWSTIEPKYLVDKAYPNLVEEFIEKKNKGKKGTKRAKKKAQNTDLDQLTNQLHNTSISEPKIKKNRKKKIIDKANTLKTNTLDEYFKKTKVAKQILPQNMSLAFDLNASTFGDEEDSDISLIIDDIVSRNPTLPVEIENLGYQIVMSHNENLSEDSDECIEKNLNQSCFFDKNYDQIDLFEKTFDKSLLLDNSSDDTEEYDVVEELKTTELLEDTFDREYVPLYERIKNKMK
ncbi:XPG-like endonuclease [Carabus blaptoides fortunei]